MHATFLLIKALLPGIFILTGTVNQCNKVGHTYTSVFVV